jgi:hypothetical protein
MPLEADRAESFTRMLPIFDPVGFLVHLRVALPTKPTMYQALDGRALWLVSASAARTGSDTQDLWRVDGKLEPIFWDGRPDGERTRYALSMFFTRDHFHSLARIGDADTKVKPAVVRASRTGARGACTCRSGP